MVEPARTADASLIASAGFGSEGASLVVEVLHQLLQEYDFQGMAIDEAMRVRMG